MFLEHQPFQKKLKNEENTYNFVNVFREGRRHQFSANLGSIWAPFWEASGVKSRKNEVPERCQKTAPNKELREREKVTQVSAPGGGAVPLNNPHSTPGHHDKDPLDTL